MSAPRNDALETAREKIIKACAVEMNRLQKEQMKVMLRIFKDYLNDLANEVESEKYRSLKAASKFTDKQTRNELIAEAKSKYSLNMSDIKRAKSDIALIPKSDMSFDNLINAASCLGYSSITSLCNNKGANTYNNAQKKNILRDKFEHESEHSLLYHKTCAVALIDVVMKYSTNPVKSLEAEMKNEPVAFDALKKRRGNSTFWKTIDAILKKLKKSASTMGVKSASFQNKVHHTLFGGDKSVAKRSKLDRHWSDDDIDDKPSPRK